MNNGSIEIFGLCGAGKTTISTTLIKVLSEQRCGIPDFKVAYPQVVGWLPSRLLTSLLIMRLVRHDPKTVATLLSDKAGRWLLTKLGYRNACLQRRDSLPGTLLIDSGILQPFVSFEVEYNRNGIYYDIENLLRMMPLPEYAVYIRVSPLVAMKRYNERAKNAGLDVPLVTDASRFEAGYAISEKIYSFCRTLGVNIAVVDATDQFESKSIWEAVKCF